MQERNPKEIPFIAFEAGMYRMEKANKRLCIALVISLVVNAAVFAIAKKNK